MNYWLGDGRMSFRTLLLNSLVVNRANDRHGELENETAAIAWLFNNREQHMRNLARDLVEKGEVFEPPLVFAEGGRYTVYDGNRRVTCLKLLADPRRAPSTELQRYFADLRAKWAGKFPDGVLCQVETDRDRIDDILYRRHTGSQNGVGQSTWDDRMKNTFVQRTGKGTGFSVADEIEKLLRAAGKAPTRKKIPRSTMNRLLSAEAFRNRLGISVVKGKLEFTHDEQVVLAALQRVANDLSSKRIVLGDIWDVDGKRGYLDRLESEGILPTAKHAIAKGKVKPGLPPVRPAPTPGPAPRLRRRSTLIPQVSYPIAWAGRLQRHRAIWEELQFKLDLSEHPNAISVLLRVLLELSLENYIAQTNLAVNDGDKLAVRMLKAGRQLHATSKIDQKQLGVITKFQQLDQLVSADTLNRYVHSPNFAPSPEHLASLWDSLAEFVVACLSA
jgi:hypothetical protein